MQVTTTHSEQVWQSPDGEKTIWNVTLTADGKEYQLKTFSKSVATVGYSGEVESYVNQRGDRFVKPVNEQVRTADLDSRIRAQWAIGQAVAATIFTPADEQYEAAVLDLANIFYKMVDTVITEGGQ